MDEPIDHIRRYHEKYGTIKVALSSGKFWNHFKYPSKEFNDFFGGTHGLQPGHREIFKDELVIEGDLPDRAVNFNNSEWISARLVRLGFEFKKYTSGNKSLHHHLFFPELLILSDGDGYQVKERLLRYIFECMSASAHCRDCKTEDCKLRKMGIDLQLTKKHMIRVEFGLHEKTDRRKILLEEKEGRNLVPKFCLVKVRKYKPLTGKQVMLSDKKCITFLQSPNIFGEKVDARERILFVLAAIHKSSGKDSNKTLDALINWNREILGGHFIESKINSTVRSVYLSNIAPGCSYIKSILKDIGRMEVCESCPRRFGRLVNP